MKERVSYVKRKVFVKVVSVLVYCPSVIEASNNSVVPPIIDMLGPGILSL